MAGVEAMYLWDNELRDIYRTIGNVAWLSRAFCSECGGSVALVVCQCPGSRQLLRIRGGRGAVARVRRVTTSAAGVPRRDEAVLVVLSDTLVTVVFMMVRRTAQQDRNS